jgi:hypothetical protein
VNHLFGEEFGEGYQPLAASGEFADPVFGHPVELMVSDKRSYRDAGESWREGEARSIARRVRELVDSGAAAPGEVVLLFAAGTDAERYESALRAQGLPTYRATGRGYFGQQQVVDLLSYLRLLQNRYDDEALVSVLSSPFVGVSNDALMLIRRNARGPIYTGLERTLPPGVDLLVLLPAIETDEPPREVVVDRRLGARRDDQGEERQRLIRCAVEKPLADAAAHPALRSGLPVLGREPVRVAEQLREPGPEGLARLLGRGGRGDRRLYVSDEVPHGPGVEDEFPTHDVDVTAGSDRPGHRAARTSRESDCRRRAPS